MAPEVKVTVTGKSIEQLLYEKGLTVNGSVQSFHTNNVLRRMVRYMPYLSGALIKQTIIQTDVNSTQIVTEASQAKYLYYGKVMEGKAPKKRTERNLEYTKLKNPLAGPYWDRRLMAAEGDALRSDLQKYIREKG